MSFLIIDGSSMLSSNYYGTIPRSLHNAKTEEEKENCYEQIMKAKNGTYTNGIVVTLRMILDIVKNYPEITHMAVVFDETRNTFRRQMYPEYKGTRKKTPSPLHDQFVVLPRLLHSIGIKVLSDPTYEADDIAGSIAKKFASENMPVIFMTKDHDYLQLIDDHIAGWMVQTTEKKAKEIMDKQYGIPRHLPKKVAYFDKKTVLQEEGVWPTQIPDKKGLCGDSSDNIPGVKGVGDTSVIPLLRHYATIEHLYWSLHMCNNPEMLKQLWKNELGIKRPPYETLIKNEKIAILSKKLATIDTNVLIDENLDHYVKRIDEVALLKIINEYDMYSLTQYCGR